MRCPRPDCIRFLFVEKICYLESYCKADFYETRSYTKSESGAVAAKSNRPGKNLTDLQSHLSGIAKPLERHWYAYLEAILFVHKWKLYNGASIQLDMFWYKLSDYL